MTELEKTAVDATNAAIGTATEHIKNQREVLRATRFKLLCVTVLACVVAICASVVACFAIYAQQQTIIEQQYALNMKYAGLLDMMSGAEITTSEYTAQADGDGSTSVAGDGNITAGSDVNGK